VLGHGLGQPGAEHHALQSCRLRTSKVESRTTSSEVTAAANSARVVISGTEFAVAAARMSYAVFCLKKKQLLLDKVDLLFRDVNLHSDMMNINAKEPTDVNRIIQVHTQKIY